MNGKFFFFFFSSHHIQLIYRGFSPSMDESATKEELRPVKKQLVSLDYFLLNPGLVPEQSF